MAELILTQEEKDALSYLDWDDASLGRLVKELGTNTQIADDKTMVITTTLAMALCSYIVTVNAGTARYEFTGLSHKDEPLGDFVLTVERVKNG